MQDVAIIGSGPAGLSASLYTTRAGLDTVIYSGETRGGLVTTTELVDNYLGMPGIEGGVMADVFLKHAQDFGADIRSEVVETVTVNDDGSFTLLLNSGVSEDFKAVIFAAGSKPRKLGVPGEDLPGVSWCSTCDGAFYEGDDVAVVGGGESAVEEALYLSKIASKVTVLVRSDDFRANRPAVEKLLEQPNVQVLYNTHVEEIHGEDGVEELQLNGGVKLPVFGLFEAIGQVPQGTVAHPHSELYSDGFVKHSTQEGFFIAGDISNPEYRQIAVAVGDGAKAAMDTIKWLQMR